MDDLKKTGTIFNIQKFSLNDGPGIRTVVFLKGCPLSCRWCANPESQSRKVQILWDASKCVHCKRCASLCPQSAVSCTDLYVRIDSCSCTGCMACTENCPARALKAEGKQRSVEEITEICMQDIDFYEESGGGVTLSGGEALMQPDFTAALLRSLKKSGLHTAIETTGYASFEVFSSILPHLDFLLFDMKHWDEAKHIQGTGVSNAPILANMKYAVSQGKDVLPRIPVIPGFNNSLEDAAGFSKRLKEVGIQKAQLLPFHQFGEKKYDMLGQSYFYTNVPALHEEDLTEYQAVFQNHGIDAFF